MCLAIGPAYAVKRGPIGRLWWRLAASPRRLFLASLLLQIAARLLRPAATYPAGALLGGIVALALFGWLLERAPHWSGRSPVHYLAVVGAALGINAGLLLLTFLPATPAVRTSGAVVLLAGCLIALAAVRTHLPWMAAGHAALTRLGSGLALVGGLVLLLPLWTFNPL